MIAAATPRACAPMSANASALKRRLRLSSALNCVLTPLMISTHAREKMIGASLCSPYSREISGVHNMMTAAPAHPMPTFTQKRFDRSALFSVFA